MAVFDIDFSSIRRESSDESVTFSSCGGRCNQLSYYTHSENSFPGQRAAGKMDNSSFHAGR